MVSLGTRRRASPGYKRGSGPRLEGDFVKTSGLQGTVVLALALAACAPAPGLMAPAGTGNVQGFVYGQSGRGQPLPLATVSVGDRRTDTGNPPVALDGLPLSTEVKDDSVRYVRHLFDTNGDGKPDLPETPAERVLKRFPGNTSDPLARFHYLRSGEYVLEAIPEGGATLTADFGGVKGEAYVNVKAGATVTDLGLQLQLPTPIVLENGGQVRVLTWSGLSPESGLVVQADLAASSLSFTPSPPDVVVRLKAPPGSSGSQVKALSLFFTYQTPANEAAKRPPLSMGPWLLPIPVKQVPPATLFGFGEEISFTVPVGSGQLMPAFLAPKAEDRASVVTAEVTFHDEGGFEIQGPDFTTLKVAIPIRRL